MAEAVPTDRWVEAMDGFRRSLVVRIALVALVLAFVLESLRSFEAYRGAERLLGLGWFWSDDLFDRFELTGVLGAALAASTLALWAFGAARVACRALPFFFIGVGLLIARFRLFGVAFEPTFRWRVAGEGAFGEFAVVFWLALMVWGAVRMVRARDLRDRRGRALVPLGLAMLGAIHWFGMVLLTLEDSGTPAHGPAASFGFWLATASVAMLVASLLKKPGRVPGVLLVGVFLWAVSLAYYGDWLVVAYGLEAAEVRHWEATFWSAAGWMFLVGGVGLFAAAVAHFVITSRTREQAP